MVSLREKGSVLKESRYVAVVAGTLVLHMSIFVSSPSLPPSLSRAANRAAAEGSSVIHEGAVLWQTPHPQAPVVSHCWSH